jgi:protein-disulfide isomerase
MTRRSIVLITGILALIAFAGAAFLYDRYATAPVQPPSVTSGDTLVRPHSPIIGPVDARVTIVEFFDPSCEACRAFYPIVKQILAKFPKDVRLVLRYTPLHEGSDEAVRILEAARLQGKFEPVLEALLARQPEWAVHGAPDLAKAWAFAEQAGLDGDAARRVIASPEIDAVVAQDVADVQSNNIRRTPTFFVNGKTLAKFGPQELYDLVRSEVEAPSPAP